MVVNLGMLLNKLDNNKMLFQARRDIQYLIEHWGAMYIPQRNEAIININNRVRELVDFTKIMSIVKTETDPGYILLENFLKDLDSCQAEFKFIKQALEPLGISSNDLHSWGLLALMLVGQRLSDTKNKVEFSKEDIVINKNSLFWSIVNIVSINLYHKQRTLEEQRLKTCNIAPNDVYSIMKKYSLDTLNYTLDKGDILEEYSNRDFTRKIADLILNRMIHVNLIYVKMEFKGITKGIKQYINRIYLNDALYNYAILSSVNLADQLPQLIPYPEYEIPSDLVFKKTNFNSQGSILVSPHKDLHLYIAPSYLSAVNYMQNHGFKVNKEYLNWLLGSDLSYFKSQAKNSLDLYAIWDSMGWPTDPKERDNYRNSIIFIGVVKLLTTYKNDAMFFNWKADTRGRLYQYNYPLNIFAMKILTPCFLFSNQEYTTDYTKTDFDSDHWEAAYKVNKKNMISVRDATASVYQIIGGIIRDENLLKYSNMYENEHKQDIYTVILSDFLKKLQEPYKNPKVILGLLDNIPLNPKILVPSLFEELKLYYNVYRSSLSNPTFSYQFSIIWDKAVNLPRSFIKNLIMTYGYNEGLQSSLDKFFEYFGFTSRVDKKNKYLNKIMLAIRRLIFSVLKLHIPKLESYKIVMRKIAQICVSMNKPIILKTKSVKSHYSYQSYMREDLNRVWFYSVAEKIKDDQGNTIIKRKKNGPYKVVKSKTDLCINKNSSAFGPNFVHFLDSAILIKCINKCKDRGIPILTNHDCFFTTIAHDQDILEIYNQSWLEVLDADIIGDLIRYNDINLDTSKLDDSNADHKRLKALVTKLNKHLEVLKKNQFNLKTLKDKQIKYSIC